MTAFDQLTSRVDAAGLIPVATTREIISTIQERSVSASLMQTVPMSTAQAKVPVVDMLPTAYWVNGDTGLKQTTKMSWDAKTLVAEEIAAIAPIPEAVLADADYDLWGQIRPRLADAVLRALDAAVVFGVNKPASFAAAVVPGATAAGQVSSVYTAPENVDQALGLLEAKDVDVTGIAARAGMRGKIRKALAALGGAVSYGSVPNDLWGYPLVYPSPSTQWPVKTDAIVGNWQAAIIGVRQDMTYKVITEGVISDDTGKVILNLPQQDSVALRIVARFAFQVADVLTFDATGQPSPVYPFALAQNAA